MVGEGEGGLLVGRQGGGGCHLVARSMSIYNHQLHPPKALCGVGGGRGGGGGGGGVMLCLHDALVCVCIHICICNACAHAYCVCLRQHVHARSAQATRECTSLAGKSKTFFFLREKIAVHQTMSIVFLYLTCARFELVKSPEVTQVRLTGL